ncbi:MAG: hypothetical protein R2939_10640 [Kofleriaceae bacterium]
MPTPKTNRRTAAPADLDPTALAKLKTTLRLRQQARMRLLKRRQRKSGQ